VARVSDNTFLGFRMYLKIIYKKKKMTPGWVVDGEKTPRWAAGGIDTPRPFID
jgi:hypothetical protein